MLNVLNHLVEHLFLLFEHVKNLIQILNALNYLVKKSFSITWLKYLPNFKCVKLFGSTPFSITKMLNCKYYYF